MGIAVKQAIVNALKKKKKKKLASAKYFYRSNSSCCKQAILKRCSRLANIKRSNKKNLYLILIDCLRRRIVYPSYKRCTAIKAEKKTKKHTFNAFSQLLSNINNNAVR